MHDVVGGGRRQGGGELACEVDGGAVVCLEDSRDVGWGDLCACGGIWAVGLMRVGGVCVESGRVRDGSWTLGGLEGCSIQVSA